MRNRRIMNKHSDPRLAGNLTTLLAASTPADVDAGTMHDSDAQTPSSIVDVLTPSENGKAAEKTFVAKGGAENATGGERSSEAKGVTMATSPLAAADKPRKVDSEADEGYDELVNNPGGWYKLNLRLKDFRAKDLLFAIEDVIKEKGHQRVRELLLNHKNKLNADTIWSLHQPLLSLLYFVLKGINDIHRKLVRVPDLKRDICKELELGEYIGKKPLYRGRPQSEGENPFSRPTRPNRTAEKLERDAAESPAKLEQEKKESPRTIKRLVVLKPGEKKAAERERDGAFLALEARPFGEVGRPKSARGKESSEPPAEVELEEDPPSLLSPQLAAGQSEAKKSLRIKKRPFQDEEKREKPSPKKARKEYEEKEPSLTGHILHFDGESEHQSLEERLEDAQIAGLVKALRARAARDARSEEELDLEERLDELETQQVLIARELEQLKAERTALTNHRLGHVGELDDSQPIRAARQKCLQAIVDLLDVLPPTLDLNAVEVFNELEATDAFDESLGALVVKQRAYLQRDWERKNALAAEARRAALAAIRKKDDLRQHLGILAASTKEETEEFNTVFSAFQLKLTELRREMERQVTLLAERGREVEQAWLVYRAAA